jgi:hypothetical protein
LVPQGREALDGVISSAEFIDGFVVDESHLGVWISVPELEPPSAVVLLKWEHFSTAVAEYEPDTPAERASAGFTP